MFELPTRDLGEAAAALSNDKGPSARNTAATHLEGLARKFIDAINARDFNPQSDGWSFFSTKLNVVMAHPPAGHDKPITRDHFRQRLQHFTTTHPTFRERVINTSAQMNHHCTHGRVLLYHECLGFPEGVVMEMVTLMEFICFKGAWLCTKVSSVRGV